MKITYLNGLRLRRGLLVGAKKLLESANYLNSINVFPVPDGDTGTNMAATMNSLAQGVTMAHAQPLAMTARMAADSALMGAKGNSGAILAQFFHGFADELHQQLKMTTEKFAQSVEKAVQRTYSALSSPKEGTILTVLKDWAKAVTSEAAKTNDFIQVLENAYSNAAVSLLKTKDILPEMKKAGVVDAGAQGFVKFLEGINNFIHKGRIKHVDDGLQANDLIQDIVEIDIADVHEEVGEYQYCTETLLEGKDLDINNIRTSIEDMGDSLIVAGGGSHVKVHIHSNTPPAVFRKLMEYGDLKNQKVDDMFFQSRLHNNHHKQKCCVIIDSGCDISEDLRQELDIDRVPLHVMFDGNTYLDQDAIEPSVFYNMSRTNPKIVPTTSQPSFADFTRKLEFAASNTDEVLYIGLSSHLSGSYAAGVRAKEQLANNTNIYCYDSRGISTGYGILAKRAALAAREGKSAAEIIKMLDSIRDKVEFGVTVTTLEGLLLSGRLSGVKGIAARMLGLRPIIGVDEQGKAAQKAVYIGSKNGNKAFAKMMKSKLDSAKPAEFAVSHADNPKAAEELVAYIRKNYKVTGDIVTSEVSPVLAAHSRPGAVSLAFLQE